MRKILTVAFAFGFTACASADSIYPPPPPAVGQIPGSVNATVAAAGNIGEVISSTVLVGSAVALTSGVQANITSIPIPAGHWQVSGSFCIAGGTSTAVTNVFAAPSTTTATLPTAPNGGAYIGLDTAVTLSSGQGARCYPFGVGDIYLSATTTYFLVGDAAFTVSTLGGYGYVQARRVQ